MGQPTHHQTTNRARPDFVSWCLRGFVCVWLLSYAVAPQANVPAAAGQQGAGRAGTLRGRVEVAHVVASGRRPGIADLGARPERDAPDRQRSIVYLESAPRAAFEQGEPAGRAAMDQRNETFVPHVLAITAGTVVDFPNSDRFYHNVFSLSKAARFDLGRYAVGKSKSVRFSQPGIVRVFCEIHSHMNAFILVFGHPFFATTDVDGRYRINSVPPGTYNVIAWNEGRASEPRSVTIPPGGVAELDFTVR